MGFRGSESPNFETKSMHVLVTLTYAQTHNYLFPKWHNCKNVWRQLLQWWVTKMKRKWKVQWTKCQRKKERKRRRKDFIVQQLETQAQHSCTLDMEHGCYGASKASNRTQHNIKVIKCKDMYIDKEIRFELKLNVES